MTEEQAIKNLEESKIRDNIKNEFCKNNGITLIRIKYDEDLEKRLYEIFNEEMNKYVVTKPGIFGAEMMVNISNDGPITLIMEF